MRRRKKEGKTNFRPGRRPAAVITVIFLIIIIIAGGAVLLKYPPIKNIYGGAITNSNSKTYNGETFNIDSCGTITASGEYTVIQDLEAGGTCIDIQANNVFIDGNRKIMSNTAANGNGFSVQNKNNITIKNFWNITGFYNGISIYNSNTTIINNSITFNKNTIRGISSQPEKSSILILSNIITVQDAGGRTAISVSNGGNNTFVVNNTIFLKDSGSTGISLYQSNKSMILFNNINSSNSSTVGLYIQDSIFVNASNNNIFLQNHSSYGIKFNNANFTSVGGNSITSHDRYSPAIYFLSSTGSAFKDNKLDTHKSPPILLGTVSTKNNDQYIQSIDTTNTRFGIPIYYMQGAQANLKDIPSAGQIILANVPEAKLNNIQLKNAGLTILNSENVLLTNVTSEPDYYYGILIEQSRNVTIQNFTGTTTLTGVIDVRNSKIVIKNSSITYFETPAGASSSAAIYIQSSNTTIDSSLFETKSSLGGIRFSNSQQTNIQKSVFKNYDLGPSIELASSNNTVIANNTFNVEKGKGIRISTAVNTTIENNNFSGNILTTDGGGIEVSSSNQTTIRSNNMNMTSDTRYQGMQIYRSEKVLINYNNISLKNGSGTGISTKTSNNVIITDNIIRNAGKIYQNNLNVLGIEVSSSNNSEVSRNTIMGARALIVSFSNFSNIRENNISTTEEYSPGIFLSYSNNSKIYENNIITLKNQSAGIYATYSFNNELYNNSIFTNDVYSPAVYFVWGRNNSLIWGNLTSKYFPTVKSYSEEIILTGVNFNKNSVQAYYTGNITVQWIVDAIVKDGAGNKQQDLPVTITNQQGENIGTFTTDSKGAIPAMALREFVQTSTDKIFHAPYLYVAKKDLFIGTALADIQETNSTTVTIILGGYEVNPPKVTILTPAQNQWRPPLTPIEVFATDASAISSVQARYETTTDNGTWKRLQKSGNVWTGIIDTSSLPEGKYTIRINATDALGNFNATETANITTDGTAPTQPKLLTPPTPPNKKISPKKEYIVRANFTEEHPDKCVLNSNSKQYQMIIEGTNCSITQSEKEDGNYSYNVTAYDLAGNSATSETRIITIDTTAPAAAYQPPTPDDGVATTADGFTANISFSERALQSCIFEIDNIYPGVQVIGNSCSATTPPLSEGLHRYKFTLTDAAQNSASSETRTLIVDKTAPRILQETILPENNVYARQLDIAVSFTEQNPEGCVLTMKNSGNIQTEYELSITNSMCTGRINAPDEVYNYSITLTDKAGMTDRSGQRTITLDTKAPNITLRNPSDNETLSTATVRFDYTASDENLFNGTIYVDGIIIEEFNKSGTYNFTKNLTAGNHSWNATAKDIAGNYFASPTKKFSITSSYQVSEQETQIQKSSTTSMPPSKPQCDTRVPDNCETFELVYQKIGECPEVRCSKNKEPEIYKTKNETKPEPIVQPIIEKPATITQNKTIIEQEKEKIRLMPYAYAIILAIAVLLTYYSLIRKKAGEKSEEETIRRAIKHNTLKGFTYKEIGDALISEGWKSDLVNKILKQEREQHLKERVQEYTSRDYTRARILDLLGNEYTPEEVKREIEKSL